METFELSWGVRQTDWTSFFRSVFPWKNQFIGKPLCLTPSLLCSPTVAVVEASPSSVPITRAGEAFDASHRESPGCSQKNKMTFSVQPKTCWSIRLKEEGKSTPQSPSNYLLDSLCTVLYPTPEGKVQMRWKLPANIFVELFLPALLLPC